MKLNDALWPHRDGVLDLILRSPGCREVPERPPRIVPVLCQRYAQRPVPGGKSPGRWARLWNLRPRPRRKEESMQLGMIGLGRMGSNMVRRLIKAGHECVVTDVSADPVRALAKDG